MILSEGRKEEILSKYIIPILAEKKLVKEYLSGDALGSIYDYLITDLFIIDTKYQSKCQWIKYDKMSATPFYYLFRKDWFLNNKLLQHQNHKNHLYLLSEQIAILL